MTIADLAARVTWSGAASVAAMTAGAWGLAGADAAAGVAGGGGIALLNFRFVYPSERDVVPKWLMDELLLRLKDQGDVKGPGKRVCRGRIFSPRDYAIDVEEWCFSEAVGNLEEQYGSD